jgi:hypothetical protein
MKKLTLVFLITILQGICVSAQNDQEAAIIKTALDYADGFYSSDAQRFEGAIHPDFNKVLVYKLPKTGKTFLQYSTVSGLLEYIITNAGFVEKDKRNINVTVLGVNENIASVKLTSVFFNDFIQLVNFDGKWKIVNVLWSVGHETPNIPPPVVLDPEVEKSAVEAAINNYYSGIYSSEVEKLEQVIHPEISIAQLTTMEKTGKYAISRNGASFIVELTRAGFMKVPEDKRNLDVEILGFMDEMAFVKATTTKATSYLQLQLIDLQWTIINVLSKPNMNK